MDTARAPSPASADPLIAELLGPTPAPPPREVQVAAEPRRTHYKEYSHEALADLRILNPGMKLIELAAHFGRSPAYLSTLMATDAFQAILARRREVLEMPLLREELDARFKAVTQRSLEVLQEKLSLPSAQIPDALILKAVELGAKGANLPGFVAATQPTPVPAGDRLATLAQRLENLIPQRGSPPPAEVVDVAARPVPPAEAA